MHPLPEAGQPGLQLTHTYRAACAVVFQAWTEPEALGQWLCPPGATVAGVELDLRVRGAFRIVMQAGATDVVHTGEYLEIQPPERLRFTWRSPNTLQQLTLVTVELFDEGGRAQLIQVVQGVRAAFPDITPTLYETLADGDLVAVRVIARGTHTGAPFPPGIPAAGKALEWKELHIFRCAHGQIVEHWGVFDMLGILQQLGAVPA